MSFHQLSKQIVEDYLGTVAYVDDLIYSETNVAKVTNLGIHDIRAVTEKRTSLGEVGEDKKTESEPNLLRNIVPLEFTNAFLRKGIHCALLEVTNEDDPLDPIKNILRKSDVVILDWQMHRDLGKKATDLIISLLKESVKPELQLIIIFTNDPEYNTILSERIIPELERIGIENIKSDETGCYISFGYTKIVVLTKENGHKTSNSVSDEELPDRIIEELTEFTEGLVSNTALSAVTLLRRNTHKLLGVFNKSLDYAYLAHRAMLPVPEDAESLLKTSITDSINSILSNSNIGSICSFEQIEKWFDNNKLEDKEINITKTANRLIINDEARKEWLNLGYKNFINLILEKNRKEKLSEDQIEEYDKSSHFKNAMDCFIPNNTTSSEDFAILTHHKSNFVSPSYIPYLTLGVIIERYGEYYLCIQQKCDSVRIKKDISRKFLFLPLVETTKKFSIIFKNLENKYIKLKIKNKDCHNIITIYFHETEKGYVFAKKEWQYYRFYDSQTRGYKWILDLNDSHAQKIVNEYAANLSRVGLDESEWLRRS